MAPKRVVFSVTFSPLPILISLVARHNDKGARAPSKANGLENIGGPQYVGFDGL
jgi:hypothetical protein